MAIRILKEVNRDDGRLPQSNGTNGAILSGMVLELANNGTNVQLSTSTGATYPWGLAADSNVQQPLQGAGGLTVGVGYDYTNFDRGGLVSVFMNDGAFELYNDLGESAPNNGNPFVVAPTAPYASNVALYAQALTGLVTSDATGNSPRIGSVISVQNAGNLTSMILQMKLAGI